LSTFTSFVHSSDGRTQLITKERPGRREVDWIKVSRLIKILHLLFVDDVLIMSKALIEEWKVIEKILCVFCRATGLVINLQKSTFHYYGVQQEVLDSFKDIYPYNFVELSEGFRYLGYFLKYDNYKAEDWH
jgi:hypothetical protein